jgi:glutaredoxin
MMESVVAEETPAVSADTVTVFYQPGCSSCLRVKEFLASRGVPFRGVDVVNEPGGMDEMLALGVRAIPVVSIGKKWAYGIYLDKVAALVGVDFTARPKLPPAALYEKLTMIHAAAQDYILLVPEGSWGVLIPKHDTRHIHDLSYHIFAVTVDFLGALEGKEYTQAIEHVPDSISNRYDLLEFSAKVRDRAAAWFAACTPATWARTLDTNWGTLSVHDMMERTVWHSGQHTRQLIEMLETVGSPAPNPLKKSDFEGLPMPDKLWA